MVAHGLDADEQLFADLPVSIPSADKPQDFDFALGEAAWIAGALCRFGVHCFLKGSKLAHQRLHSELSGQVQTLSEQQCGLLPVTMVTLQERFRVAVKGPS